MQQTKKCRNNTTLSKISKQKLII